MTWWSDDRIPAGFWYGELGGLVPLPNLEGQLETEGSPEVVLRGYGHGKRRALVRTAGPRTWSCTLPNAYPDEAGVVQALARGRTGWSAKWWITPEAMWQNLLTPAAAEFTGDWVVTGGNNLHQGGVLPTVDGSSICTALPDYNGDDWVYGSLLWPVNPTGGPNTVSLYLRAAIGKTSQLRVAWYNAAGYAHVTTPATTAVGTTTDSGPLERLTITASAPPGAHAGRIQFRRASAVANPTVTWTTNLARWAHGHGCRSALLHGLRSTPGKAGSPDGTQGVQTKTLSFAVSEVNED